jgi:hypothetical protein
MTWIAGIGVLVAGLVAIGFGIQDKEFEVGKTLILAGTAVACTGVIMLGLAVVVRELRKIARRPRLASPRGAARAKTEPRSSETAGGDRAAPGSRDGEEPSASSSSSAPWQDEAAARDRARASSDVTPEAAPPEPATATKPRRNLLFSSSSRRERDRALARTTDPAAADSGPPAPVASPAAKDAAPASFEDAWPQSDRARSDAVRRTRTPSTFAEPSAAPAPERPTPAAPSEEPAPVTVLKSGVVDGMAYSLYSDGSIEAQMPEGMMRFASIDELRSHLDQRP